MGEERANVPEVLDGAVLVPPPPPPPEKTPAPEEKKAEFQRIVYDAISSREAQASLHQLLTQTDKKERLKAWELVLKHGWPITKDGDAGGGVVINFVSKVPRPALDVTPRKAG